MSINEAIRGGEALVSGLYSDKDIESLVEADRIPFMMKGLSSGKGWRIAVPPIGSTSQDNIVRREGKPFFIACDGTEIGPAEVMVVNKEEAEQLVERVRRARFIISQRPLGINE
jgi:hypothetical protein